MAEFDLLREVNRNLERIAIALEEGAKISEKHLEYFTKYHCPVESTNSEIQSESEHENVVKEITCTCNHPKEVHTQNGCMVKYEPNGKWNFCQCTGNFNKCLTYNEELAKSLTMENEETSDPN